MHDEDREEFGIRITTIRSHSTHADGAFKNQRHFSQAHHIVSNHHRHRDDSHFQSQEAAVNATDGRHTVNEDRLPHQAKP